MVPGRRANRTNRVSSSRCRVIGAPRRGTRQVKNRRALEVNRKEIFRSDIRRMCPVATKTQAAQKTVIKLEMSIPHSSRGTTSWSKTPKSRIPKPPRRRARDASAPVKRPNKAVELAATSQVAPINRGAAARRCAHQAAQARSTSLPAEPATARRI